MPVTMPGSEVPKSDRIMTTHDVAKLLQISEYTVIKWRQEKKGPPYNRIGHSMVRYNLSEVLEWLNSHKETV